jgi:ApbE superfamily uncharacterized protein (UPF0280 family)
MEYRRRTYRNRVDAGDLVAFRVAMAQTNLMVLAARDLTSRTSELVRAARRQLHAYRRCDAAFFETLKPHRVSDDAPGLVRRMADVAALAGVGPMAAVAGAIAEHAGRGLAELSDEVIVENGGDIHLRSARAHTVGVFAGTSALSGRIALRVESRGVPFGIACSSATVGPSMSFGGADAAVVVAESAPLADAVATGMGNRVRSRGDIERALAWALAIEGVRGALVVVQDHLGALGEIELTGGGG